MVFKRREKRRWTRILRDALYPRGGWGRAFEYARLRMNRLPGSPEQISRGLAAGVFISFTPLFGLHMPGAVLLAYLIRGNMLAGLLGTFFANPLTYVPIAYISLRFGRWVLGEERGGGLRHSIGRSFAEAGKDLWQNFKAMFTPEMAEWGRLSQFWDNVFFPWLVGSIVPGLICAVASYYLAVPVIRAYQNHRRGRLKAKLEEIKRRVTETPS